MKKIVSAREYVLRPTSWTKGRNILFAKGRVVWGIRRLRLPLSADYNQPAPVIEVKRGIVGAYVDMDGKTVYVHPDYEECVRWAAKLAEITEVEG